LAQMEVKMRFPLLIGLAIAIMCVPPRASAEDAEHVATRFMNAGLQQRKLAESTKDKNLQREYLIGYYAYTLAGCEELERTKYATNSSVLEMCPRLKAQVDSFGSDVQFKIRIQENSLLLSR
jgi:hypothetical protein